MKNKIKNVLWVEIYFFVASVPMIVFGANDAPIGNTTLQNPLGQNTDIYALIQKVVEIAMKLGVVIAVLFIIYSGFLFVKAQGNSEKLEEAKKTFFYTIVGTAVLLGSWVISSVIQETIKQITG